MRNSGSHPYFQFGIGQRRYPIQWRGGAGGVFAASKPAAETHELSGTCGCSDATRCACGEADLPEAGISPYSIKYPAFNRTRAHMLGDWPAFFAAGPEELDPGLAGFLEPSHAAKLARWQRASGIPRSVAAQLGDLPIWSSLSDNEKRVILLGGAAAIGWWLWKRSGRAGGRGSRRLARATRRFLRNPARRRRR